MVVPHMAGHTPRRFQRAVIDVIVEARESAGISQRELSDRLERSKAYVHKIEAGQQLVPAYDMLLIAEALGLTFREFAERVEKRL